MCCPESDELMTIHITDAWFRWICLGMCVVAVCIAIGWALIMATFDSGFGVFIPGFITTWNERRKSRKSLKEFVKGKER